MKNGQLPRVLALHDLCVFGRCSLTAIIPVLSARGVQCCPLPTALLSTPTNYSGNTMLELTGEIPPVLAHLSLMGTRFDALYSGFLPNERQAELVEAAFDAFPRALHVVDPVLGDNGRLYRTMNGGMVAAVRRLAKKARLITPNVTEAAVLLDKEPSSVPADINEALEWLRKLSMDGLRSVVLTGLTLGRPDELTVAWFTDGEDGFLSHPRSKNAYPGAGDLFTAHLLSGLLHDKSFGTAVQNAALFVCDCAALTAAHGTDEREGLLFEAVLKKDNT